MKAAGAAGLAVLAALRLLPLERAAADFPANMTRRKGLVAEASPLLRAILALAPRVGCAGTCGTAPNLAGQQHDRLPMLGIGTPVGLAGGLWLVRRALADGPQA